MLIFSYLHYHYLYVCILSLSFLYMFTFLNVIVSGLNSVTNSNLPSSLDFLLPTALADAGHDAADCSFSLK